MADPKKVAQGKKSRTQGNAFEKRVRKDLEEKGWIVDKWSNNVEFDMDVIDIKGNVAMKLGKLVPAKAKWNNFTKSMMMGTGGFPDFVAFRVADSIGPHNYCEVIGVESKMAGKLDKAEKEKCKWLLDNHIFSKILIAKKEKIKNRIYIIYEEFENDK